MPNLKKQNVHPYEKANNLKLFIAEQQERRQLGLINGKIVYKGLHLTKQEFDLIEPVSLNVPCIHLDPRQGLK